MALPETSVETETSPAEAPAAIGTPTVDEPVATEEIPTDEVPAAAGTPAAGAAAAEGPAVLPSIEVATTAEENPPMADAPAAAETAVGTSAVEEPEATAAAETPAAGAHAAIENSAAAEAPAAEPFIEVETTAKEIAPIADAPAAAGAPALEETPANNAPAAPESSLAEEAPADELPASEANARGADAETIATSETPVLETPTQAQETVAVEAVATEETRPTESGGDNYVIVAGTDVVKLGFALSTLPPDPVIIKRINANTWADDAGMQAGERLVALNGVDVSGMSPDEFKSTMQARPLSVCIAKASDDDASKEFSTRSTLLDTNVPAQLLTLQKESAVKEQQQETIPFAKMDPETPSTIRAAFLVEGTRGDIQPYVAVALRMQERGMAVKIFTNVDHKSICESFDIAFDGVLYDMSAALGREDIKDALKTGSAFKVQQSLADLRLENMPEDIKKVYAGLDLFKPTMLLAGYLSKGKALTYSIHRTVPMICLDLQAMLPVSDKAPGGLPSLPFGTNGIWFSLLLQGLGKQKTKIKEILQSSLDIDLNGKFEMPYLEAFLYDIPNLPGPCCYGFSPVVIPIHEEWPKTNFHPCGFFIIEKHKQEQLMKDSAKGLHFGAESNAALTEFLAAGGAPVYLGWGSMICTSPEWMVTLAAQALQHAGARGVLLGGWAGLGQDAVPADLQDYCNKNVIFVPSAPHEWLFPQCACIVHHGGSGTTAASVRSGRPTLITPLMADQFDFAEGVNKIGCGIGLGQLSGLTSIELGDAIKRCLEEESIISAAREVGAKLMVEDGCGNFLRVMDEWLVTDFNTGKWLEKHTVLLEKCKKAWKDEQESNCTVQ